MTGAAHVVHVVQSFGIGGLERMTARLARVSQERGLEAEVVAYLEDGPIRQELKRAGVRATLLPKSRGRALALARFLRDGRATHIHTHHLGPYIYGLPGALALGLVHVHTEHSHEFYDTFRRRAVGRSMHCTSRVVAVSEEVASFHEACFSSRPRVIHNGVAARVRTVDRSKARAVLGLSEHMPVLGTVGRLAPEKNQRLMLELVAQLAPRVPAVRAVFVGDGPIRGALEKDARALGVEDRVVFTGSRRDVERILPAFDLFVLTSRREGLPMAVLEAMAAGVPFVSTPVGDMPRLAAAGAGVVRAELAPLVEAAADLLRHVDYARSMGRTGRRLVETHYSEEAMVNAYLDIYFEDERRHRSKA